MNGLRMPAPGTHFALEETLLRLFRFGARVPYGTPTRRRFDDTAVAAGFRARSRAAQEGQCLRSNRSMRRCRPSPAGASAPRAAGRSPVHKKKGPMEAAGGRPLEFTRD